VLAVGDGRRRRLDHRPLARAIGVNYPALVAVSFTATFTRKLQTGAAER